MDIPKWAWRRIDELFEGNPFGDNLNTCAEWAAYCDKWRKVAATLVVLYERDPVLDQAESFAEQALNRLGIPRKPVASEIEVALFTIEKLKKDQ